MKCPKCDIEMAIKKSKEIELEGKAYVEQTHCCRNKQCPNFGKVVEVTKNLKQ